MLNIECQSLLNRLFFQNIDQVECQNMTHKTLCDLDEGELFIEYTESETLSFDHSKVKSVNFNHYSGYGLRGIKGEAVAYSSSNILNKKNLYDSAETIKFLSQKSKSFSGNKNFYDTGVKHNLYAQHNPTIESKCDKKIELLREVDEYIRRKSIYVQQVSLSLSTMWQAVYIITKDGKNHHDFRPLVRMNISVICQKDGRVETGSSGFGNRYSYDNIEKNWQHHANYAVNQALVNLSSVPAKAGKMQIVLGSGWPAVLLHEAVGHGLEGDFNRKESSNYTGKLGQKVASEKVTIIDDGTMFERRGSLNIDDEGTPTSKTYLIDGGIAVNYMQDKLNARLMNVVPTGNGRRESYASVPMPRMTNTYMQAGGDDKEQVISSVKNGIYAVNFSGGQVDITSGNFVFSAQEAYMIENGKITSPIKGATLIGNGPEVMKNILAVCDDLELDAGIGTCGKAGQNIPVGVGQPTILVNDVTVGGTEL